jgi:hypothetical protein
VILDVATQMTHGRSIVMRVDERVEIMWIWVPSGLVILLVVALTVYLPIRWGRGALGGSFMEPENEIQNTTPWKGPPMF